MDGRGKIHEHSWKAMCHEWCAENPQTINLRKITRFIAFLYEIIRDFGEKAIKQKEVAGIIAAKRKKASETSKKAIKSHES